MDDKYVARQGASFNARAFLLPALLILALAACGAPPPTTSGPRPSATPSSAPPTAAPTALPGDDQPLTLIWWTPEFLSPEAPHEAGAELTRQLGAFTAGRDGQVRVQTARKARYGKGGLLDSLRTAAPVAPGALPDIIALDVVELEKAVESGLLQPLNTLVDPGVSEGLYAFATEAGQFGDQLYAMQYLADVGHAVVLPQQVAEAPQTWAEVIDRRVAYLFPLAGPQSGSSAPSASGLSHAVLGQYLSAGATLGADRRLLLEAQPLRRLLSFYEDATDAGVLPPASLDLSDGEAVWSIFAQGQAPMAYASARKYAAENGTVNAGHALAPGLSGPATSITGGWALAIVTRDERRQAAAAALIAWLLRPENAGAWARAGGWLPTSAAALQALGIGEYSTFLDAQMAAARSAPVGTDYATTAERIHAAITAVVSGESDAADATEGALSGQP